jgi:deoxyribonuclease V
VILATDVLYDEQNNTALAAGVLFSEWRAEQSTRGYTLPITGIQPYEPGSFYKRELPCLLALLDLVKEPLDVVIVDGYVDLAPDHHGLGWHLYEALERRVAVVGVAKTHFAGSAGIHVLRGESKSPLYVTAAGMDMALAAYFVQTMQGPHRTPTLLKLVDSLSRGRTG